VHENTAHHYAKLVGALRLFICNEPLIGNNDIEVCLLRLRRHSDLVAVIAEHWRSCCVKCPFKATVICDLQQIFWYGRARFAGCVYK